MRTYADVGAGGGGAPEGGGARRDRHGPDARPGAAASDERHCEVEGGGEAVRCVCVRLKGDSAFSLRLIHNPDGVGGVGGGGRVVGGGGRWVVVCGACGVLRLKKIWWFWSLVRGVLIITTSDNRGE